MKFTPGTKYLDLVYEDQFTVVSVNEEDNEIVVLYDSETLNRHFGYNEGLGGCKFQLSYFNQIAQEL